MKVTHGLFVVLFCGLSGSAHALKPSAGKAHAFVRILKNTTKSVAAISPPPVPPEIVCERTVDLPVLDLRNQKGASPVFELANPCQTEIGGHPATVDLQFASALRLSALDQAQVKTILSVINVSDDSSGNYFRLGGAEVETSDLNAKDLGVNTSEMAYLLTDLPPNREIWSAQVRVEFSEN